MLIIYAGLYILNIHISSSPRGTYNLSSQLPFKHTWSQFGHESCDLPACLKSEGVNRSTQKKLTQNCQDSVVVSPCRTPTWVFSRVQSLKPQPASSPGLLMVVEPMTLMLIGRSANLKANV